MKKENFHATPRMGWARFREAMGGGKHTLWMKYAEWVCQASSVDEMIKYATEHQDIDAGWGSSTDAGNALGFTNPQSFPSALANAGVVARRGEPYKIMYFLPDFEPVKEIKDSYEAWAEEWDSSDENQAFAESTITPQRVKTEDSTEDSDDGKNVPCRIILDTVALGHFQLLENLRKDVDELEKRLHRREELMSRMLFRIKRLESGYDYICHKLEAAESDSSSDSSPVKASEDVCEAQKDDEQETPAGDVAVSSVDQEWVKSREEHPELFKDPTKEFGERTGTPPWARTTPQSADDVFSDSTVTPPWTFKKSA